MFQIEIQFFNTLALTTIRIILTFLVIFRTSICIGSDPTFLAAPVMNSEILCDLLGAFNFSSVPMYERLLSMTNSTEKRIILDDLQKCLAQQEKLDETHKLTAPSHCDNATLMKHKPPMIGSNVDFDTQVERQRMQWLFEFGLKTTEYFPKNGLKDGEFKLPCYETIQIHIKHCVKEWLDFNETDSMCRNFDVLELCFNLVYKEYCKDTSVTLWLKDFRNVLECPPAETIDPDFPSNIMEAHRVMVNIGDPYTSFNHKANRCLGKRNVTLQEGNYCVVTFGGAFKKPPGPRNNCSVQWTESILPCKRNQPSVVQDTFTQCEQLFFDDVKLNYGYGYESFHIMCHEISRLIVLGNTKGTKECRAAVLYTDILCFREMKSQLSPGQASVCKYYEIYYYCTRKSANQFCSTGQYPTFTRHMGKRLLETAGCNVSASNDLSKYEKVTRGLQRHVKLLVNAVGNVSQALTLLPKVFEVGKMDGCVFKDFSSVCNQFAASKENDAFQSRGTLVDVCEEDQSCWKSIEEDLNRCYPTHSRGTLSAKFAVAYREYLCDHFSQFLQLQKGALRVGGTPLPCHQMLERNIGNCTDSAILERSNIDASMCGPVKVIKECVQKYYTDDCHNPNATSLVVDLVANISHQLECEKEDKDETSSFILVFSIVTASVVLIIGVVLGIVFWKLQQARKHILSERERDYFLNGNKSRNPNVENVDSNEDNYSSTDTDPSNLPYDKTKYEISENALKLDETKILGAGNFGLVFKGTLERDGTEMDVAVKTLKQDGIEKSYLMSLLTEIKIMMYIGKHSNIVTFVGAVTKNIMKGDIFVVSEFCPLGNLLDHLREGRKTFINQVVNGAVVMKSNYANLFQGDRDYKNLSPARPITTAHLINWAFQVAKGMMYLGEKKVIHSDLAARNVLLTKDRIAKITDFGLSRKLYHYSQYVKKSKEPLPWRWMAPESLADFTFTPQSDIWSYGILLWELFTLGNNPFGNCHWSDAFVTELRKGRRPAHPEFASDDIYNDIMLECWRFEAEERIRFNQICEYFHALKSSLCYEHKESASTAPTYNNINVEIATNQDTVIM